MKVFILAAGKGSRLKRISSNNPKCLTQIDGKSLLSRNLVTFAHWNLDITIITGFAREKLEALGLNTLHNQDFDNTNMVWSLYQAIDQMDDDFIVCYGDIVVSPSSIRALLQDQAEMAVASDKKWLKYWSQRFDNPLVDREFPSRRRWISRVYRSESQ